MHSQVVGGRGLEAHEIRALSGNVSQDGAVLGTKVQEFTCKLCTLSKRTVDINTASHQLFGTRSGELKSTQLPPCEDRTVSSWIQCTLTTRLASGVAVSNNICKFQARSSVAGSEMTLTVEWEGEQEWCKRQRKLQKND